MTKTVDWRDVAERTRHRGRWPQGEAMCMTVGVALEAFDRQSQVALAAKPGAVDEFSLSYADYGLRAGLWRLLELFDEYGVRASFSVSGRLASEHPQAVAAVVSGGHEVVGHGWVNDAFLTDLDDAEEQRVVGDTLDAIESGGGVRPIGWASPANSSSARTKALLVQEGIRWSGDDASDDLPFVETVGDAGHLAVLPKVNLAANDLLHWVWPHNPPSVFRDSFVDTFDTQYAEAQRGRPQWSDIVLHCHMAGRPTFMPTLRAVIDHARARKDVWWATKGELADWVLDQRWSR